MIITLIPFVSTISYLFILDVFVTCQDKSLNVTIGETTNITSPMYPYTPTSEFPYQCIWIIKQFADSAYLFEFIEFRGPDWFVLRFESFGFNDHEYYFHITSKNYPRSITLGNRTSLIMTLQERVVTPARQNGQVFLANVTAMPFKSNGKLYDNIYCFVLLTTTSSKGYAQQRSWSLHIEHIRKKGTIYISVYLCDARFIVFHLFIYLFI